MNALLSLPMKELKGFSDELDNFLASSDHSDVLFITADTFLARDGHASRIMEWQVEK